jgi:hypothetical protein
VVFLAGCEGDGKSPDCLRTSVTDRGTGPIGAFMRPRLRVRLRRKGEPPPAIALPEQMTTCRRVLWECRAHRVPLQWPAMTHNRLPGALPLTSNTVSC